MWDETNLLRGEVLKSGNVYKKKWPTLSFEFREEGTTGWEWVEDRNVELTGKTGGLAV